MSALELSDDPFKAALGSVRGSDRDDAPTLDEESSEVRIDFDYDYFIVAYDDGYYLAEHGNGETWIASNVLDAARFGFIKEAEQCMDSHPKEGGKVYRIASVTIEPCD